VSCYDFLSQLSADNVAELVTAAAGVLAVAWVFRVLKRALFS